LADAVKLAAISSRWLYSWTAVCSYLVFNLSIVQLQDLKDVGINIAASNSDPSDMVHEIERPAAGIRLWYERKQLERARTLGWI
jgi:hypothetical protein